MSKDDFLAVVADLEKAIRTIVDLPDELRTSALICLIVKTRGESGMEEREIRKLTDWYDSEIFTQLSLLGSALNGHVRLTFPEGAEEPHFALTDTGAAYVQSGFQSNPDGK